MAQVQKNYVGAQSCQSCHPKEHQQWQGSHHDLAMQEANEKSVLGDFNSITFIKGGITTTFYKKNHQFMVNTDGEDGKLADFQIAYTFGVYPLQQYMVRFPKGRVQVLDIAWDTRSKEDGGQRWFSLHPDETIRAGDVLHWTGPNLNWNYMCADCHSTNLKKNYQQSSQTYDTQWDAINVSCEACHGPASEHILWAEEKNGESENKGLSINFPLAKVRQWSFNKNTQQAYLSTAEMPYDPRINNHTEVELCAKCHSRRSQFSDEFVPGDRFRDHYLPSMLTESLYYPDGKIRDEVYVYGSFKQSKMYQSGVSCSDCHNSHTLELKAEGDKVCQQCHLSTNYATSKHHFHSEQSKGANCIACHMPAKTYMGVDQRNDHSFRIPRPDLAQQLDMPDACTNCHQDKNSQWSANAIKKWYGKSPKGYQQFGRSLQTINSQSEQTISEIYKVLLSDTSDIAKATVISHLGSYPSRQTLMTSLQMLKSQDADFRRAALQSLEAFPIQHTLQAVFQTLNDPVKMVRLEAAKILSSVPAGSLEKKQKQLLERVIEEYRQSLLFVAERPESQLSLALLYQNQGEIKQAKQALDEALRLQSQYVPAYINYAQFLQQQGRVQDAYNMLQQGIKKTNGAALYHSLGLWFIRQKDTQKALDNLQKAAQMQPDNARFQYVLAVAIGGDDPKQAIKILETSLQKHSGEPDILMALMSYYKQLGDQFNADRYRRKIDQVMTYKP